MSEAFFILPSFSIHSLSAMIHPVLSPGKSMVNNDFKCYISSPFDRSMALREGITYLTGNGAADLNYCYLVRIHSLMMIVFLKPEPGGIYLHKRKYIPGGLFKFFAVKRKLSKAV